MIDNHYLKTLFFIPSSLDFSILIRIPDLERPDPVNDQIRFRVEKKFRCRFSCSRGDKNPNYCLAGDGDFCYKSNKHPCLFLINIRGENTQHFNM